MTNKEYLTKIIEMLEKISDNYKLHWIYDFICEILRSNE